MLSRATLVWKCKTLSGTQLRQCSSMVKRARDRLSSLGEGDVNLQKDETSGIATVTLQHQEKKNALSGSMMVQFADIVDELSKWEAGKGVILQAEGDSFCSGGDLTTVKEISNAQDGLLMSTFMHDALTRFYCLPFITTCLVHGKAIGGGAELTTVTDFRVFTNTGEVRFVHGRMGVAPGWGGGTRLVKLVGPTQSLELLTTGSKMNSAKASEIGFANHTVEVENRLENTKAWLMKRVSHSPEVIQAMKRIVIGARDTAMNDSLLNERLNSSPLFGGPANLRALDGNIKHK